MLLTVIPQLVSADQLLAHVFGDYIFQSDWMAQNKTKRTLPAVAHVLTYAIPFILLLSFQGVPGVKQLLPLLVILGTHLVIDRFRLARYLVWLKNWIAPTSNAPWSECAGTGYHKDVPPWMSVWLMIIVDNSLHVLINALALKFLV